MQTGTWFEVLYFHTRWLLPAPSLEDHHGDSKAATGLASRAEPHGVAATREAHSLARVVSVLRHRGRDPRPKAMELQGMRAGQEQRMV